MREVLTDADLKRRLLDMGIVADPTSPEDLAIAENKIEQR